MNHDDPRTEMGRLADCYAEYCIKLMAHAGQDDVDKQKIAALRQEIKAIEETFSAMGKQVFFSPTSGEILIGPQRLHA